MNLFELQVSHYYPIQRTPLLMHAVFICSARTELKVQEEGYYKGFITFFLSLVSELNRSVVSAFLKDGQDCLSVNEATAVMDALNPLTKPAVFWYKLQWR